MSADGSSNLSATVAVAGGFAVAVDVIVRGGLLVSPDGPIRADLAIEHGTVSAVGPDLEGRRPRRSTPGTCTSSPEP